MAISSAINNPGNNQNNNQTTSQSTPNTSGSSITDGLDFFSTLVSTGSETENQFMELMKKTMENSSYKPSVILVPGQAAGIYYSTVVIALKDAGKTAVHFIALGDTNDAPSPEMIQIGERNIEVTRTPSDLYDKVYVDQIIKYLQTVGISGDILVTDGCVFPAKTPIDQSIIGHLAANALAACLNEHAMRAGKVPMSINTLSRYVTRVNTQFGRGRFVNVVGEPQRTDFSTEVSVEQRQQQRNAISSMNKENSKKVVKVNGFIDLLWAPVANNYGMPTTQKFLGNAIITDVSMSNFSMHTVLLGLLAATNIADDNNSWWQVFKPTANEEQQDVGALNIEGNLESDKSGYGKQQKASKFNAVEISNFLNSLLQRGLLWSFDAPDFGAITWATSSFRVDPNAEKVVFRIADELTNGELSKRYNGRVFMDFVNRVHLGHYQASNGEVRDIRDIGYLAVANAYGASNVGVLRTWTDSFSPANNQYVNLATRKSIIDTMTGKTAVYTGKAHRVSFDGNFIRALTQAAIAAGFQPIINNNGEFAFGTNRYSFNGLAGATLFGQNFGMGVSGPSMYNSYNRYI